MKWDETIWLSVIHGDNHSMAGQYDMYTVYTQPTVWNGILCQEPAMRYEDTRLSAHRSQQDTPAGLSIEHGDTQLQGDPYNMVEGTCSAHLMKRDGNIWLSVIHGDTHPMAGQYDMYTGYTQPTIWNGIM